MNTLPEKIIRKKLRLPAFNYQTEGYYFVTVCTHNKRCLFGHILDSEMYLNAAGMMIESIWLNINENYPHWMIDSLVVMPNHVHAILVLQRDGPARRPAPTGDVENSLQKSEPTLSSLIGSIKSYTTTRYRQGMKTLQWPAFEKQLWQRSYYDHIIRNEVGLEKIRQYIIQNPAQWAFDQENPFAEKPEFQ